MTTKGPKQTAKQFKLQPSFPKWGIALLVVLILGGVGVLLYAFVFKKKKDDDKETGGTVAPQPPVFQPLEGYCEIKDCQLEGFDDSSIQPVDLAQITDLKAKFEAFFADSVVVDESGTPRFQIDPSQTDLRLLLRKIVEFLKSENLLQDNSIISLALPLESGGVTTYLPIVGNTASTFSGNLVSNPGVLPTMVSKTFFPNNECPAGCSI